MRLLVVVCLCASLAYAGQEPAAPQSGNQNQAEKRDTPEKSSITIPAGSKVILSMTSPVWSKTVKEGDSVYAISAFPVAINNQMAIPPGTYAQGVIDAVTKPTRKTNQAVFLMHFTKLIFANGYTVPLGENSTAATATVYVQVNYASDILLDTGSQIEMTLQSALSLDAENVAVAARRSKAPPIGPYPSATRCRPTVGTPGSSDTVIPGTPGMPGTPDTVIPGGPGMPDTVIPGTPATPGTPDTIIPGSPGTPGFACPGPPIVTSGPSSTQSDHLGFATFVKPVQVGGKTLAAGTYQFAWSGLGPTAQVKINQKGKQVVSVKARVVVTEKKAPEEETGTRSNPDGSLMLQFVQFQEQTIQLHFD